LIVLDVYAINVDHPDVEFSNARAVFRACAGGRRQDSFNGAKAITEFLSSRRPILCAPGQSISAF
jgi:hypothetical protein